jgi:hypothetical protein
MSLNEHAGVSGKDERVDTTHRQSWLAVNEQLQRRRRSAND